MRQLTPFSEGWTFCGPAAGLDVANPPEGQPVTLPHSAETLPLNYFDERVYQRAYLYTATLSWMAEFDRMEVSLVFDGAMADAEVFVNGALVARHADGYTPFEVVLTDHLYTGQNQIAVRLSGEENPAIPPFGGQIDYLTYAGLYREVWLKVVPRISVENVQVITSDVLQKEKTVKVDMHLRHHEDEPLECSAVTEIVTATGDIIARGEATLRKASNSFIFDGIEHVDLWSTTNPVLYYVHVRISSDSGADQVTVPFGFREAEFRADGFFLNGQRLKIRGLNRHQSYPYVGYAMGRRAQERDAEILKHELKCNLVRTSHYPQSKWFLDHCDRIGLLVFEEIPGWQHIGGADWKKASLANIRAMIERDWNHPSIIIWGVRINESADDHAFYTEANRLARSLDETRPTGGVRCIENSEFLEDVYTMNDFWMGANEAIRGNRPPGALRRQEDVTGLGKTVPYLVTEYNGHMFPTKRTDPEERQAEHVMRHLKVLDAAYADEAIAGCIGWCMADYNTHRDFGAGDKICYHGVMDIHRQPKFAAWVYKSQCDPSEEAVLKPVTYWARGERAIGGVLPLIVLTNCDEVSFQYGTFPARRVTPDRETFAHLPHAPVIIDDRFVAAEEVGAWGMTWEDGVLIGYVGGEAVASVRLLANPVPEKLAIYAETLRLSSEPKDTTRIIVEGQDGAGQLMPFLDDVISVDIQGPASIIGPDILVLRAGSAAFWIQTTGGPGEITVSVFGQRLGSGTLVITAAQDG